MTRFGFTRVVIVGLTICFVMLSIADRKASATDADELVQAIQQLKATTAEQPDSASQGQIGALQSQLATLIGSSVTTSEGFLQPPPNDLCTDAVVIDCTMGSINGDTSGAGIDTGYPTCGTASVTSPGVWYTITGNGGWIRVDTCTNTSWDSKISVFTTSCDLASVSCVDGNDDFCSLQSQVEFTSTLDQQYWVLVHGFGGAAGPFTLTITCEIPVELQSLSVE